jgi:hypothetical protein
LISIAPGLPSDDLKGRLFHVTLDQAPKYDALSYCWAATKGTVQPNPPFEALKVEPIHTLHESHDTTAQSQFPPAQGHISVDGQSFQPTANLEAALRQLRSQNDELVIWIDAICIDQSNTKERNEQVGKMRLIYNGAEVVRIWLGESYDQSGKVFGFIRKLSKMWQTGSESEGPFAMEPCNPKDVESMASLFERAYWHRVWVVQEVTVARRAVVHCRPDTVIWSEFLNTLRAINFKTDQIFGKSLNVPGLLALASCAAISFTPEEQPTLPRHRLRFRLEELLIVHFTK